MGFEASPPKANTKRDLPPDMRAATSATSEPRWRPRGACRQRGAAPARAGRPLRRDLGHRPHVKRAPDAHGVTPETGGVGYAGLFRRCRRSKDAFHTFGNFARSEAGRVRRYTDDLERVVVGVPGLNRAAVLRGEMSGVPQDAKYSNGLPTRPTLRPVLTTIASTDPEEQIRALARPVLVAKTGRP